MREVVDIAEEMKKYDREWLLFEVAELTEQDLPVRGRLLCHSTSRDEIHEVAMRHRGSELKITFVGERVPPGSYVVLCGNSRGGSRWASIWEISVNICPR